MDNLKVEKRLRNEFMNDEFKKLCACGALSIIIYGSTPLCKKCLEERHIDLPQENYVNKISFSTTSTTTSTYYVIGTSGTTTTMQPPYMA